MVHDSGDAEHQERQGVTQHIAKDGEVIPSALRQGHGQQACRLDKGSEDITEEDIIHIVFAQEDQEEDIKADIEQDEEQFERSKSDRAFLITQISKGNARKGINGNGSKHHLDKLRMIGITQNVRQGLMEDNNQRREQCAGA